jgi:hypothetical protein
MEQTFDLNKMGLAPMTGEEMRDVDGGFFPIVIYGVMVLTASETFACFLAGVGIGAAVAQGQKK